MKLFSQGTRNFSDGGMVAGTLTASAGAALDCSGGTFGTEGPSVSGQGAVQLTCGSLTLLNDMVANLALTRGTIILRLDFQGGAIKNLTLSNSALDGTNGVTGTLNLAGGSLVGPLTIASGGVLNMSGNSTLYLANSFTNAGTVNWLGGVINLYGCNPLAGPIVNLPGGVCSIQCYQSLGRSSGGERWDRAKMRAGCKAV